MKSLIPRKMTAVSIVALALAASGCGGGSSKTPAAPTPMTVSMASVTTDGAGYMAPGTGTLMIDAGMSQTSGSVTFTCAAGGGDCTVMVAADGSVTSTGGMVTAMNSTAYQAALDSAMKVTVATALDDSTTALTTWRTRHHGRLGQDDGHEVFDDDRDAGDRRQLHGGDDERAEGAGRQDDAGERQDGRRDEEDGGHDGQDGACQRRSARRAARRRDHEGRCADRDGHDGSRRDGEGSLQSYVETVTGTNMAMPMTAADKGEEVAMAIAGALGPAAADNGAGLRVRHGTDLPPDTVAAANRYMMDDAMGMTFAMIVGEANLMDMRVAATGGGTRIVKAKSVDGMKTMDLFSTVPDSMATTDGTEIDANVEYKGIPGLLFCAGADCMVEGDGDARELAGSWYVAADNPMHYYMKPADNPETPDVDESRVYRQDTMYAVWGHWLTVADNGEATVDTFARAGTMNGSPADPGNWGAADPADANLSGTTATYSGSAAGRSVHRTTDANGMVTDIRSGRFMADVTLTAKFSATPMLGGTIDNFRAAQGSSPGAVDSSWTVTLTETASDGGTVTAGVADASGQDGTWEATSYGEADMRPAGIYGGFNAHFTDGDVAGAWATRKQ